VPESPSWLVINKRFDEARMALKNIAYWNGANVNELVLFRNESAHMSGRAKYITFQAVQEQTSTKYDVRV
jgi:hypothetical protein